MNQRSYDSLTPEQQAVIDNNSGMKWAENAGAVFDRLDVEGKQEAVDAGHTLEERGLDQARDVYQAALAASESCSTQ